MAEQKKNKSSSKFAELMQQLLSQSQGNVPNYSGTMNAQQAARDPQYAAGMVVGKILNALSKNWLENYIARGQTKERNPEPDTTGINSDTTAELAKATANANLPNGDWLRQGMNPPPANAMPNQKQAAIDAALPVPDIGKLLGANNNITNVADDEEEYLRRLQETPYPFYGGMR